MSVNVTGEKKLLAELEKRLGKNKTQQVSDDALKAGAEVFVKELKSQMSAVRSKGYSKGYTVQDITISEPMTIAGVRTVKIHWNGPHGRYRIIHLNEWGTVKNPGPPLKGVIASSLRSAESAYRQAIKQAIGRGV